MVSRDRIDAFYVLQSTIFEHQSLSLSFQLRPNCSPYTKTLCFGICRHYFSLVTIAHQLLKKKPKPELLLLIIIGLYELNYLNKPDYAVVNQIVSLAVKVNVLWAKGFINGTLRTFCREKNTILAKAAKDPLFEFGLPEWLFKAIKKAWPNDYRSIITALNEQPPLTLRVNQQKTTREAYLQQLASSGIEAEKTMIAPDGLLLKEAINISEIPGFTKGRVSVQDEGAQLAALLTELVPGARILDACAAPGGKTGHLLEKYGETIECVAIDIEPHRIEKVKENLNRLSLTATLICHDAADICTWWDKTPFDFILLDAPCSATGVMRRQPDVRLHRTPEDVIAVSKIQSKLLSQLWRTLKQGGQLLYMTCSLLPQENDEQIQAFLSDHPDACIKSLPISFGQPTEYGIQLLPTASQHDGFYYALVLKMNS